MNPRSRGSGRPDPDVLPSIQATDLNGDTRAFPAELARPTLFVVAFERQQQPHVDRWLTTAREVSRRGQQLDVYELPVVRRRYRWLRPLLDQWMRAGIPPRQERARVLTLYQNQARFARRLAIPSDRVSAVLADPDGILVWRSSATPNREELENALQRMVPSPPPSPMGA